MMLCFRVMILPLAGVDCASKVHLEVLNVPVVGFHEPKPLFGILLAPVQNIDLVFLSMGVAVESVLAAIFPGTS